MSLIGKCKYIYIYIPNVEQEGSRWINYNKVST